MSNKYPPEYTRLIEDLTWLKSDISGLVHLRLFSVARIQLKRLNRLLFLKTYIENLGYVPNWFNDVRRIY